MHDPETPGPHAVVVGGGRVGRPLVELVADFGGDPVVVEADADRCATLESVTEARVVHGDGRRRDALTEASVGRADVTVAVTGDSETNIAVCETARDMAPSTRTVARADSPESARREAGRAAVDSVVFPERAGARLALSHVFEEARDPLGSLPAGIETAVLVAAPGAPVVGRSPREVTLPGRARVVADLRQSTLVRPEGTFEAGHEYLVAMTEDVADEVRRRFEG
jgi:trk system potassium uptake protein TrkA